MVTLLTLLVLAQAPLHVEVVVPLCDGAQLGCGRGALGDPSSLDGNLYWGAMYGAERFLARAPGFTVVERVDGSTRGLLRSTTLRRKAGPGERPLVVTLHAFDGRHIDDALADFFTRVHAGEADLVVWAGHDRLMDRAPPVVTRADHAAPAAVLACVSEAYFGPVLASMGARPVVLTRSFMAPEAYLLEALLAAVARHGTGDREAIRSSVVKAYARYQRISEKSAGTVFSRLR